MDGEKQLRSLPSVKKQAEDLEQLRALRRFMNSPLGKLIVGINGGNPERLESDFVRAEKLAVEFEAHFDEVVTFNKLLTPLDWIYYNPLSLTVVRNVNAVALGGDLEAAEAMLVKHYDGENLWFGLNQVKYVEAFKPRMARAKQAHADHLAGRYDMVVLTLLTLIDGMVQDASTERRGFFAEGTDLRAYDSIVAHDAGLMELARIFSRTRPRTNSETLTIPYRNGILHGTDLDFGNQLVVTKLWALLFALREWALKSERGELQAPPPKPEPTWKEVFKGIAESHRENANLAVWKPRKVVFGTDLPATGTPDLYETGMPEHTLVTILCAWKTGNYGTIRDCMCRSFQQLPKKELFKELRNWIANRPLKAFTLERFEREVPGALDIATSLRFANDPDRVYPLSFRLVSETHAGKPSFEGAADARWGLLRWNTPVSHHPSLDSE